MYVELVKGQCYISSQLEDIENTAVAAISGPLGGACVLSLQNACSFFYCSVRKSNTGISGLSYVWKPALPAL